MFSEVLEHIVPESLRSVSVSLVIAKLFLVVVIYAAAKLAIRLIIGSIRRADDAVGSYDLSTHTYKLAGNLVSAGVYFIAVLTVFWMFGLLPAVYTLLTAAGFVGIVIGFGLKDVLSNFVSGMILAVEQPFKIGEEIEVKSYGGVVEDVSIRMTTIRLWDGRLVYIPNAVMLNEPVINLKRSGKRQVEAEIKLSPEKDLSQVVDSIKRIYDAQKTVLKKPEPTVTVNDINPKEVNLKLRFWFDVNETNYQDVKASVMKEVKKAVN